MYGIFTNATLANPMQHLLCPAVVLAATNNHGGVCSCSISCFI
jgi:hypothetical protein